MKLTKKLSIFNKYSKVLNFEEEIEEQLWKF